MIEARNLTKDYGDKRAVDDLSFDVKPGIVTGFLGPNGSGKSTTMRVMLGLDRPTKGQTSINGHAYHDFPAPLREVGAQLDAKSVHPGRSARNHLRALAVSNSIPLTRVDEVLEFAGITSVADKKMGGFSLGMSQRLGIAAAILGDPGVLLFDEPINGLDPEGIRWIREFFATLAREGRTVFVSSHLMSEMSLTADQIIVIGRGHFIAQGSVDELTRNTAGTVFVASTDNARLAQRLRDIGASVAVSERGLEVGKVPSARIGAIALEDGIALSELTPQRASLEEVFMELTADSVEYGSARTAS